MVRKTTRCASADCPWLQNAGRGRPLPARCNPLAEQRGSATGDSSCLGSWRSVGRVRTTAERVAVAKAKLAGDADVWVATGDSQGVAHLVPLSLCWHEGEIVVAAEARSRTARTRLPPPRLAWRSVPPAMSCP